MHYDRNPGSSLRVLLYMMEMLDGLQYGMLVTFMNKDLFH